MAAETPREGRLRASVERSRVLASARRTTDAVTDSRLAALATWLVHATRHSFLYRWLTKEPEPEVIVIDLRDTYTVGPVIEILNRLVDWLAPIWRHSLLKRVTEAVMPIVEGVTRTRTGRTIAALLEPPDPPEED